MNEQQQYVKTLPDYIDMVRRRKLYLILPAATIFLLAAIVAITSPAVYQSKATILIEEQEIPRDFVVSAISSYAAQQVQVISQRILTVKSIKGIVEKYQLYQNNDSNEKFSGAVAQRFRNNMALELLDAEAVDPRTGRPTRPTIAFTLAFSDSNPATAQQVTDELVTLFLNQNLRDRNAQAVSTAEFLEQEVNDLNAELLDVEQRLATFKTENEGSLPELYQFNLSILERAQQDIMQTELRIQELEARKLELSSKLAELSPTAPLKLPSGDIVMSDADRLQFLQSEYRRNKAVYRDNHPDIIRLEREISALQAELGISGDVEDLHLQLAAQQEHLAALESKYNDNHPEIVSTRRIIAQLESSIRATNTQPQPSGESQAANNPAYVMLQTQLSSIDSEIRTQRGRQQELRTKIDHYESLVKRAPIVEKEYRALLRDYDTVSAKYKEIKAKERIAAMSIDLEQGQKGERFTVIEPPALPAEPISPNRPAIMFLGFVLAVGAGVGCMALREALDSAVHGIGELESIIGEPALVVIPYIDNDLDAFKRQRALKICLAIALAVGLIFALYLYFSFAPLDELYNQTLTNQGNM
jgi:uncharacterized protein involved in exopolysaccharide biosynthesis